MYQDSQKPEDAKQKHSRQRRSNLKQTYFSRKAQADFHEAHCVLWPGIRPPAPLPTLDGKSDARGKMPEKTVGTSHLIATLLWMLTAVSKRSASCRRAFYFLKELVNLLAVEGLRDTQWHAVQTCGVDGDGTVGGVHMLGYSWHALRQVSGAMATAPCISPAVVATCSLG